MGILARRKIIYETARKRIRIAGHNKLETGHR